MPLLLLLASITHRDEDYDRGDVIDTEKIDMAFGEARDLLQYGKAELV